MSVAEERERAARVVGELKRRHPCPCVVIDCPFKGTCCICIRNHLEDGTLPACCLPPVKERNDVEYYPDCRSPLLWLIYWGRNPRAFEEEVKRLQREELRREVKAAVETLYYLLRSRG